MARLPDTYAPRRIADFSRPMAGTNSANTIESAFDRLGRAIEGVGDASEFIVDRDAAVRAVERDTTFARNVNALLYDPESGFLTTSKENAVEGRKTALERLKTMGDDVFKDLDPRVASKVRPAIERRIESAMATIDRHTATERRNWMVGSLDARTNRAMDDALTAYNSDEVIEENLKIGIDALKATGELAGWSEEEFAANRDAFVSKTFRETTMRRAKDNPVAALEFARKNADRMTAADLAYVEATLEPLAKDYRGREFVRRGRAGGYSPEVVNSAIENKDWGTAAAALLPAVTGLESGGVAGKTSPKGAIGIGQMMPDTAKAAAKRLGIAYDADKALNDPEYGQQLATEELRFLIERFDGNIAMALVGYHGGPGLVDSAVKKYGDPRTGEISTEEWLSKLPYSDGNMLTRDYVRNILGRTGGGVTLEDVLAIPDPRERDAALGEWKMMEALKEGQVKKARAELENAVFAHVEGGGLIDDLPPEVRVALGREEMSALRSYEEKKASGVAVKTDPAAYYELRNIAELNPEGFANVNLLKYVDKLSASDLKQMIDDQAKARKGGKIDPTYSGWREALLFNAPQYLDKDNEKKLHALLPAWKDAVDGFIAVNKRTPNKDEEQELMAKLVAPMATGASWWQLARANEVPAYEYAATVAEAFKAGEPAEIDGMTVTPQMMSDAMEGWAAGGGTPPQTMAQMIEIWRQVRANILTDTRDPSYAPGMPVAPAGDVTPGAGGRDAAVSGIGGARSGMGLPGVSQGLGEVSTRRADPLAPSAAVPPVPATGDTGAWNAFGERLVRAVAFGDEAIRLSDGTLVDASHWAQAVEEMDINASYGELAQRALEIARSE